MTLTNPYLFVAICIHWEWGCAKLVEGTLFLQYVRYSGNVRWNYWLFCLEKSLRVWMSLRHIRRQSVSWWWSWSSWDWWKLGVGTGSRWWDGWRRKIEILHSFTKWRREEVGQISPTQNMMDLPEDAMLNSIKSTNTNSLCQHFKSLEFHLDTWDVQFPQIEENVAMSFETPFTENIFFQELMSANKQKTLDHRVFP